MKGPDNTDNVLRPIAQPCEQPRRVSMRAASTPVVAALASALPVSMPGTPIQNSNPINFSWLDSLRFKHLLSKYSNVPF